MGFLCRILSLYFKRHDHSQGFQNFWPLGLCQNGGVMDPAKFSPTFRHHAKFCLSEWPLLLAGRNTPVFRIIERPWSSATPKDEAAATIWLFSDAGCRLCRWWASSSRCTTTTCIWIVTYKPARTQRLHDVPRWPSHPRLLLLKLKADRPIHAHTVTTYRNSLLDISRWPSAMQLLPDCIAYKLSLNSIIFIVVYVWYFTMIRLCLCEICYSGVCGFLLACTRRAGRSDRCTNALFTLAGL